MNEENGKKESRWVVSCACLPYTNLLATGSYNDSIRLWDVSPMNREKDSELIKKVNAIEVVRDEIDSIIVGYIEITNDYQIELVLLLAFLPYY